MICLRCGYCCINYDVMIVNDPKIGIIEANIIHKPFGIKCKHLIENDNYYTCNIHNYEWYIDTPCYAHTQIENKNSNCRIGEYVQSKKCERK